MIQSNALFIGALADIWTHYGPNAIGSNEACGSLAMQSHMTNAILLDFSRISIDTI
jgi:hypothetical protein